MFNAHFIRTDKIKRVLGIDTRSLALFRISIALLILADLFLRSFSLEAFYTSQGILPVTSWMVKYSTTGYRWSFHLANDTAFFQVLMFLIAGYFAICLLLGYHTRLATIISWIFLVSLHQRNPLVLNGGDILLRLLLFWSMFLPLGATVSMDQSRHPKKYPQRILSVASIALILQVLSVYLFSFLHKDSALWFPKGMAVLYVLGHDFLVTSLGTWIYGWPTGILRFFTYSTWLAELVVPLMLLMPFFTTFFRLVGVSILAAMHLGFVLTLKIGLFPLINIASLMIFLPTPFWDFLNQRYQNRYPVWFSHINPKGEKSEAILSTRGLRILKSLVITVFLLTAMVSVFLYNIQTLRAYDYRMPKALQDLILPFRLDQRWRMFGRPATINHWYVLSGTLANKKIVDVYQEGNPVAWEKPTDLNEFYKNIRWRRTLISIHRKSASDLRNLYALYFCDQWNATHTGKEQLVRLRFHLLWHKIMPKGEDFLIRRKLFFKYTC